MAGVRSCPGQYQELQPLGGSNSRSTWLGFPFKSDKFAKNTKMAALPVPKIVSRQVVILILVLTKRIVVSGTRMGKVIEECFRLPLDSNISRHWGLVIQAMINFLGHINFAQLIKVIKGKDRKSHGYTKNSVFLTLLRNIIWLQQNPFVPNVPIYTHGCNGRWMEELNQSVITKLCRTSNFIGSCWHEALLF